MATPSSVHDLIGSKFNECNKNGHNEKEQEENINYSSW